MGVSLSGTLDVSQEVFDVIYLTDKMNVFNY